MSNFRDEANWLHKLRQMFGHTSFRRHQKDVIQQTLQRRDSLVVMATGAGKSICYQLAPLLSGPPYKPTVRTQCILLCVYLVIHLLLFSWW
jgi:superfamily II DNA helicase RecQ